MPQPTSYNTGNPVSGSIQDNSIAYVVDGQARDYRGGYGGLSWMSELNPNGNVVFIGNTTSVGRGPANTPLFWVSPSPYEFDIINTANHLPSSPGNLTTLAEAYEWSVANGFFINNAYNPIPRTNADGLALYVDAGLPTSYPHTRNTWYDLGGSNNNGSILNGTTWDSKGWFDFDGVDDTVQISSTSLLNTPNGFTGESWVRFDNTSAMVLIHKDNVYSLRRSSNNGLQWADGTNWSYSSWGTTAFATGTIQRFYHIAATKNGSTVTLYGNGEVLESKTFGSSGVGGNTNDLYIGSYNGGSNWMNGNIAKTKIHNKALTQTEIKQSLFQSNIVQDGLVFMADAGNLVSYVSGSTNTYSLTGSLSGSLINGVGYSADNGGYWAFDGVDDYIGVNNLGLSSHTIEGWFSSDATQGGTSFDTIVNIMGNYSGGSDKYTMIGLTPNNINFRIDDGVDSFKAVASFGYTLNTWYHVALTYNSSDGVTRAYVNGSDIGGTTASTGIIFNSVPFQIAKTQTTSYFNGSVPSTRVYNRDLTAVEIQQNYQETKDKFQPTQNIIVENLTLHMDPANPESVDANLNMVNLVSGASITKGSNTTSSFDYGARSMISSAGPEGSGTLDTGFRTGTIAAGDKWVDSANPWTVQTWIYKHSGDRPNNWWHVITDGSSGDMFTVFNDDPGTMRTSMNNPSYGGVFDVGSDITYGFNWRDDVNLGWNLITLRYDSTNETVQLSINDQHDTIFTGRVINPTYRLRNFHGWGSSNSSYHSDPAFSITLAYQDLLTNTEVEYNYNAMKSRFGIA